MKLPELHVHLHFPPDFTVKVESETPAVLAELIQEIKVIHMKLSEIKAAVAASAAKSTEAFAELGSKISALQAQIADLIAGASDPDVTDEAFLADLTTLQSNVDQLAEIVPNEPAPAPPVEP